MPVTAGFTQWAQDHADVMDYLTGTRFDPRSSRFLHGLSTVVRRRQALTPAQVQAVHQCIARDAQRAQREAVITQDTGEGRTSAPSGRQPVRGTVTEVQTEPGYGPDQVSYKMTVDCGTYVVWCTVPGALVPLHLADPEHGLIGRDLQFNVTLSPTEVAWRAEGKSPRSVVLHTSSGARTRPAA